jgi:hypothetical protein
LIFVNFYLIRIFVFINSSIQAIKIKQGKKGRWNEKGVKKDYEVGA